ncbi:hypothetical protein GH714_042794 [Hevea brasiliensis]|uniref:Tetrapyrrole biosynthesis uroporphyrinogen III synthase domain-containing protein n=1 Tax=Hevea brasiliensis TaxID=3981 RepID=A0A6A6JZF1_HEVBR|nr:hypothetical protein GH714_042794 [Hevea brasiliensis]
MLVLTRASADSAKSRGVLERLGFDVFVEPMFEVVHLRTEALRLHSYGVTVATSRNGVDVIAKLTDERDACILTVGDSTMRRATALGFTNVVSAGGTVHDILSCLGAYQRGAKILYARGEEVSCDLRSAAEEMGFEVEEAVLYKVVARKDLSPQCCDLLMNGEVSGVVFYSTGTAKIFTELSGPYSRLLRNVCKCAYMALCCFLMGCIYTFESAYGRRVGTIGVLSTQSVTYPHEYNTAVGITELLVKLGAKSVTLLDYNKIVEGAGGTSAGMAAIKDSLGRFLRENGVDRILIPGNYYNVVSPPLPPTPNRQLVTDAMVGLIDDGANLRFLAICGGLQNVLHSKRIKLNKVRDILGSDKMADSHNIADPDRGFLGFP